MAFLDKLSGLAKNAIGETGELLKTAGDRTSDMIEINKIRARINAEQKSIEENKSKLGAYYYDKYKTGAQLDEDAAAMCLAIHTTEESIAAMQADIERIRAENAKTAEPPAEPAPQPAPAASACHCTSCGAELAPGVKFCGVCGAKVG